MNANHTVRSQLHSSPAYIAAKAAFLKATLDGARGAEGIRGPASPEIHAQYLETIKGLEKLKGREAYFQYLSSGIGSGPFIELMDGSRKLDLITGIGINFFGHAHPALIDELLDGITSDVMQGNLQPGFESEEIIRTVLANVGPKSRLKHGWLLGSGTMANETALKIIRQKKFPATRIFAFSDAFAGRSTAMQEISDNPKYREGQPTYGEVTHLPFYDPKLGIDASAELTVRRMEEEVARQPGKYAGMMIEIVQGEGGIRFAPREWYLKVFEAAKKANLAIWADEVQTFGRLESLFAYQHFDLAEYFDVVTIGKLLHACMALYSDEMNPRAGLVAGTFTGSAAALRTGRRVVEMLTKEGFYGPDGKIAKLSKRFREGIEKMKTGSCKRLIGEVRVIGGMIGFGVLSQNLDDTKKFLAKLFGEGVVAFYAGHDPYVVRCLPPFGVMKEAEVDLALSVIEKTLLTFKT
ncbi:MAG: aminotransferase class III-fold pyridoxal phosphate-dependent enzyme [Bdellovibrionales bacterium]|nr:aminotransferase class III-fold pyridoxal phosphate-dependent enzyme [Bdellovibrionales bacterium]